MDSRIYLVRDDNQLGTMSEERYAAESLLQELLASHPELLAGDQMGGISPRRWLLISREMQLASEDGGAGRWSVDHLFLDQDAVPTIVEVKRSTDTRIRREVVGQMLDYADNAVMYWPIEAIRTSFETNTADPEDELTAFLGGDTAPDAFWDKARTNLKAGKIRMVFVADQIPPELQRIVEFLNGQLSTAEVLAVEIRQYVGQGLKTLVPRVIGLTAEAGRVKNPSAGPRTRWNEESFLEDLAGRGHGDLVDTAKSLFAWAAVNLPAVRWNAGKDQAGVWFLLPHAGVKHYVFSMWSSGWVNLEFGRLKSSPPFNDSMRRLDLVRRLNAIPHINLPDEAIQKYTPVPMSAFRDKADLRDFERVLDWVVKELQAA